MELINEKQCKWIIFTTLRSNMSDKHTCLYVNSEGGSWYGSTSATRSPYLSADDFHISGTAFHSLESDNLPLGNNSLSRRGEHLLTCKTSICKSQKLVKCRCKQDHFLPIINVKLSTKVSNSFHKYKFQSPSLKVLHWRTLKQGQTRRLWDSCNFVTKIIFL